MRWRGGGGELGEEREARLRTKGEQMACSEWVKAPPTAPPAHAQKEASEGGLAELPVVHRRLRDGGNLL